MKRVHVICEGQTEEMFVNELLRPHFSRLSIFLTPSLIGKVGHKGGNVQFERLFIDLRNRLKGDKNAYCTTFFDFYGLPHAFPGKADAMRYTHIDEKSRCIHEALTTVMQNRLGDAARRFIPYVQMYEFEALLFSDPHGAAQGIGEIDLSPKLQTIRDEFPSPEAINDNVMTAPSKRIIGAYPGYEKPLHGVLAALHIGLPTMQRECQLFNMWLDQIEALE